MAKIINGVLRVSEFTPTINVGEYSFQNAIFNNQADSGNGAYDIVPGFVIYIPASDVNTFTIVPGVSGRYVLTVVDVIDTATVSGTILWDGDGEELYAPTNGVSSIISQTTPNLKIGVPAIDSYYPEITPGSTMAAVLSDTVKVIDKIENISPHLMQGVVVKKYSFDLSMVWSIKHNLDSTEFTESITNLEGDRVYAKITIVDSSEFLVEFNSPEAGLIIVMFCVTT